MQADTKKLVILVAAMSSDGGTLTELADKAGVSDRTVSRYLADARKTFGMEIEADNKVYHVVNWGAFRKVWFTAISHER